MREARSLGGLSLSLQHADVSAETVVQEIDDRPHRPGMAHPLVGEQPQDAIMIVTWRQTADEVGVRVGGNAGQDGNPEP